MNATLLGLFVFTLAPSCTQVASRVTTNPSAPIPVFPNQTDLPYDVEKSVRDEIYTSSGVSTAMSKSKIKNDLDIEVVVIPATILDAYSKYPKGVIKLLLSIAEGAESRSSVKAIAYSFAIIDSPGGVVCSRNFKREKYDDYDPDWKGTPRHHWIEKLKRDDKIIKMLEK